MWTSWDKTFSTMIEAPAEALFALVTDLDHYDRWLPGSQAFGGITEISPLPVTLGTTYRDAGPAGVRQGEVTEFEPPRRVAFHQPMTVTKPLPGRVDIHLLQTFDERAGATEVSRRLQLQVEGTLAVASPLVKASFHKENVRTLKALKEYAERSSA